MEISRGVLSARLSVRIDLRAMVVSLDQGNGNKIMSMTKLKTDRERNGPHYTLSSRCSSALCAWNRRRNTNCDCNGNMMTSASPNGCQGGCYAPDVCRGRGVCGGGGRGEGYAV